GVGRRHGKKNHARLRSTAWRHESATGMYRDKHHALGHASAYPYSLPTMIEFGHGTHPGLRRAINEDTYCADPGLGLFLVADGMGGHVHGMRASALARDSMCAAL